MANAFINFFKEPAPKEIIKDKSEITAKYKHFRTRLMYSLYLGYVVSYIGRKNLSIAMPSICQTLGVTKTQLGLLGGTFYVTYGVGKMVNGILADRSNVRTFFPVALICAAVCLFCFAISVTFSFLPFTVLLWLMSFFWGASGWFQSMTFPPIAKSLSYWFTKKERGMKWSLISTSHQIGVFCAIGVANVAIATMGWQGAFYIPGAISLLAGFWLFNRLRDKPRSLGLPAVEDYEKMTGKFDASEIEEETVKEEKKDEKKMSYMQMLTKYILVNPVVWILSISFMFIYVVRTASEDWIVTYFTDKGDGLFKASSKLLVLSVFGATGTMVSGFVSEKLFKGKRTPVNILFLIGLLLSLFGFSMNLGAIAILDYVYAALIGVFCAGLQNLVGLHIVESCASNVASAANGFGGTFSYIGAFLASSGTGFIADKFGWSGAFNYWIVCTVLAIVLVLIVAPCEKKRRSNS